VLATATVDDFVPDVYAEEISHNGSAVPLIATSFGHSCADSLNASVSRSNIATRDICGMFKEGAAGQFIFDLKSFSRAQAYSRAALSLAWLV
jgi:hypothetical protein